MVARQIRARGVVDERVLEAMRTVPRELFVPEVSRPCSYDDRPLPIGASQTISQPYIVGVMIEALSLAGGETVLEVGAGCGYAAAVLSRIAKHVVAIERIGDLADAARRNLSAAGISNVDVRHGDGTAGAERRGPYDAILVSAAAPEIPEVLIRQLKMGGAMVVPVGDVDRPQQLLRITRTGEETFDRDVISDVRFVPLIAGNADRTA